MMLGENMRDFNYSLISKNTWDSEVLGYIAAIYKEFGKQEMYLKQRPEELEKLVEIAKIQSTEDSNAIECIVTTNTRIKQLVEEKLPVIDMVRKAVNNKIGWFTKQDIRELYPSLSVSSIEGALRKLIELGEIRREGNGKNNKYVRLK